MHCEHCLEKISKTVGQLKGIEQLSVIQAVTPLSDGSKGQRRTSAFNAVKA